MNQFWIGFGAGVATVGVVGYGLLLLVALFAPKHPDEPIDQLDPRRWPESEDEARFV
jgi:hypothetical protein